MVWKNSINRDPSKNTLKRLINLHFFFSALLPLFILSLLVLSLIHTKEKIESLGELEVKTKQRASQISQLVNRIAVQVRLNIDRYSSQIKSFESHSQQSQIVPLDALLPEVSSIKFIPADKLGSLPAPLNQLKDKLLKLSSNKLVMTDLIYEPNNHPIFYLMLKTAPKLEGFLIAKVPLSVLNNLSIPATHFNKSLLLSSKGFVIRSKGFNLNQLKTLKNNQASIKKSSNKTLTLDQEKYFFKSSPVHFSTPFLKGPTWNTFCFIPSSQALSLFRFTLHIFFVAFIILLFPLIWTKTVLDQFILSPIHELLNGLKLISKNIFNIQIQAKGALELKEVTHHFNLMSKALKDHSEKEQKHLKETLKQKNELEKSLEIQKHLKEKLEELNKDLENKITERTKEITDLKFFQDQILETIPTGLIVSDQDGTILYKNSPALKVLQKWPKKDISKTQAHLPPSLLAFATKCFNTSQRENEFAHISHQSKSYHYHLLGTVFERGQNLSPLVLISIEDISLLKELEKKRILSQKLFSIGLLSSGMLHDLNNIFNRLKLSATILKKKINTPSFENYFIEIFNALDDASVINQSLPNLLKSPLMTKIPINLYSFLEKTKLSFTSSLEKKSLIIAINGSEDLMIETEPKHFTQIFHNLLGNAIDSIEDGKDGNIQISFHTTTDLCIIIISDNGRGIPLEKLPFIFEPFYSTKESSGDSHSGLGLPLVKELVEMLEGTVQLKSKPKQGTQITLSFPHPKDAL